MVLYVLWNYMIASYNCLQIIWLLQTTVEIHITTKTPSWNSLANDNQRHLYMPHPDALWYQGSKANYWWTFHHWSCRGKKLKQINELSSYIKQQYKPYLRNYSCLLKANCKNIIHSSKRRGNDTLSKQNNPQALKDRKQSLQTISDEKCDFFRLVSSNNSWKSLKVLTAFLGYNWSIFQLASWEEKQFLESQ